VHSSNSFIHFDRKKNVKITINHKIYIYCYNCSQKIQLQTTYCGYCCSNFGTVNVKSNKYLQKVFKKNSTLTHPKFDFDISNFSKRSSAIQFTTETKTEGSRN